MISIYKDFIANKLKGKNVHFKCDCILKMDVVGVVVSYSVRGSEIVYRVRTEDKYIDIGENTPKLQIEIL